MYNGFIELIIITTAEGFTMEKKTKELVVGDMVLNVLNRSYYPLEAVEKSGSGYIVTMTPANINGNRYYAEYATRHQIQA